MTPHRKPPEPEPAGSREDLSARAAELNRGGDWDGAAAVYESLWRWAVQNVDVPTMVLALRMSGLMRNFQDRSVEAEELVGLSWEIAERHGLSSAVAHALNVMGVIRHTQADLGGALPLYEDALDGARDSREDRLIGQVCQNLGVIANMRGDFAGARTWYLESVGSSVRSGDQAATVRAYNNLGMVCGDLREWMEAEVYFGRGIEIAEEMDDAGLLALLYLNRAEPLINIGEIEEAKRSLTRAEEIGKKLKHSGVLADAARFRAVLARRAGDLKGANRHLSQSLLVAAKAGLTLERAESLEELALLRWEEGNHAEAMSTAREANHVFTSIGAEGDARRIEERLEEWETAGLLATWSAG
jgi:tetratricopeptide (TPR) repeat protein